jgi:hypothetical protein
MFLNRLAQEEKIAFLELAHYISRSDDDFSETQKNIISQYCMEMAINDIDYSEESFNLDQSISKITNKESQKIVLLEVMALVYADNILHDNEKVILDSMILKFGLNPTLATVYAEWSKATLALFVQGNALIEL